MAQKVEVKLVDDIDGGVAAETITFSLEGTNYEIDLSDDNAEKLRQSVAEYVEAGRRVGKAPKASPVPKRTYKTRGRPASNSSVSDNGKSAFRQAAPVLEGRERTQAIRAWAATQPGITLADRGRIPQVVQDRYDDAHA